MPQPGMQQASRPYITFERRGIEKRRPADHPQEPGMLYVEEVDFVKITPQGSKDIFEKDAKEWFDQLAMKVHQGMEPMENQIHYQRLYDIWKTGQELPLDGTPIKGWPLATLAEQQRCISINLLTVESLANCNQEAIMRIGMGAQALRKRAEDWLQAKTETGPLVMKMEAQQVTIEALQQRLQTLEAESRVLKSLAKVDQVQPAGQPAPSPMLVQEPPEEVDPNLVGNAVDIELAQI